MTDHPDTQIDPRFDPAFQRGFVGAAVVREVPGRHVVAETPKAALIDAAPPSSLGSPESEPVAETVAVAETDVAEDQGEPDPRNPFIIALWITGPALILLGSAGYWVSNTLSWSSYTSADPFDSNLRQAMTTALYVSGIPMLAVGLATVAALLFWRAARGIQR